MVDDEDQANDGRDDGDAGKEEDPNAESGSGLGEVVKGIGDIATEVVPTTDGADIDNIGVGEEDTTIGITEDDGKGPGQTKDGTKV